MDGSIEQKTTTIVDRIQTQYQKIINDYFEARKTETNLLDVRRDVAYVP